MAGAASSPLGRFLRTWRREIVRGGVLFGLVVACGMALGQVRVNAGIPWEALAFLRGFDTDHDGGLFGGNRSVGDVWEWRGALTSSQQVWIRNMNGPVKVVAGTGDVLEVITEKSWRRSTPSEVRMVAVPSARGVTICALWPARNATCDEDGRYRVSHIRRNDVAVRFTIKLPRGIPLDVETVNGELAIDGAAGPVTAETVNGAILVRTANGPVKASTVNGSIDAALRALGSGDIELETVNGSINVRLPDGLNAVLDAATVNGRVETEFPVQVSGRISPRQVRGTIGSGGATLRLNTVNGSIGVRHLRPDLEPPKAAVAPDVRLAPRVRTTVRVEATPPATPPPAPAPAPEPKP